MIKKLIRKSINYLGYDIVPKRWSNVPDYKEYGFEDGFFPIYNECKSFTMTSAEKMFALYRAVRYLDRNGIKGDFVECGVAAGGSMMMAGLTAMQNRNIRTIWLYDTFAGMPEPTDNDVNYRGDQAHLQWAASQAEDHNEWCYASLDTVKQNMAQIRYPSENLHFIKGKVEDTIPVNIPQKIALLRLDTDWYASTKHELLHLYPILCEGGVLIIDDYGHWEGCRKATDEFFSDLNEPMPLFHRIDRLGVICTKPARFALSL